MSFVHDDFLLTTPAARRLYHEYAEDQPILDYHCHLSPKDIADNRQFANLFEIWLEGDHYKWRAMRANGVAEAFCTGDAGPYDKFLAWARTVPHTLRNPLYHWTHLELKRYFGIDELLDETTAPSIWEQANALLATDDLRAHGILDKFHVRAVCTTDDPTDDLAYHKRMGALALETRMYPTFRPDKALNVHLPDAFNPWVDRLRLQATRTSRAAPISRRAAPAARLLPQPGRPHLRSRAQRLLRGSLPGTGSRGDLRQGPGGPGSHAGGADAVRVLHDAVLRTARCGEGLDEATSPRRPAQQQHPRAFETLGPDTGFDSIGDWPQVDLLGTVPRPAGPGERACPRRSSTT